MNKSYLSNKWLKCGNPNPNADLRLFCFPHGGGGAGIYRNWGLYLPNNIEVFGVQLPGRGNRSDEPPCTNLEDLAKGVSNGLCSVMDKPFALFGHCFGAIVAYALARKLREQLRIGPVHLIVSGRRAPHLPSTHIPYLKMSDEQLIKEVCSFGGTATEKFLDTDLLSDVLPTLKADILLENAYYHYQVHEKLNCPISVFGGLRDRIVTREQLEGWKEHTCRSFDLHMYDGNHFYFLMDRRKFLEHLSSLILDTMGFQSE